MKLLLHVESPNGSHIPLSLMSSISTDSLEARHVFSYAFSKARRIHFLIHKCRVPHISDEHASGKQEKIPKLLLNKEAKNIGIMLAK